MGTPPLKPHPARRLALLWAVMGVLFVLGTPSVFMGGFAWVAGLTLGCGLLFLQQALVVSRRLPSVQHVNLAAQHLSRGAFDDVRAEHELVSAAARRDTMLGRVLLLQQALIALYEGRLQEAEVLATRVLTMRRSLLARQYELQYDANALATRALARVARGDAAGAKADADAAEASKYGAPDVVARARLVKALLISRAADHEEALREYLVQNAQLVLEHGMPRERMLFRALRRMSRSAARSVYREPAVLNHDHAPSKTQSWIAAIAPEAAAFTSGDRMLADTVEEAPLEDIVPSDMNAIQRARRSASDARPSRLFRFIKLWGVLVAGFIIVWRALSPPAGSSTHHQQVAQAVADVTFASALGQAAVGGLAFAALMGIVLWRGQQIFRKHLDARRLLVTGHVRQGILALQALAGSKALTTSAAAHLELARIASRAGDFPAAITHADAGISRVSKGQARILSVDLLLPSLMMESAVAMAARGGADEAAAELALLEREFPTFSQLALAHLRTRLMIAVRIDDRERARRLAKSRTAEMRVPYREDMLADLVLASHGDLDEQDLVRVDAELANDADLRAWIDRVAPGLRSALPPAHRARVASAAPPELLDADDEEPVAPVALRMR